MALDSNACKNQKVHSCVMLCLPNFQNGRSNILTLELEFLNSFCTGGLSTPFLFVVLLILKPVNKSENDFQNRFIYMWVLI